MPDALDTAHSVTVTDHVFDPAPGEWWSLCRAIVASPSSSYPHGRPCGLGQAAHAETHGAIMYAQATALARLPKRCPNCVETGINPCIHRARG